MTLANVESQKLAEYILQPWEESPYRLISWLEMLEFSARKFFWVGHALEQVRADCLIASMVVVDGDAVVDMSRRLDDKAKEKALKNLKAAEEEFTRLGLRISAETVREAINELSSESFGHNFQWLGDQVRAIQKLADKEMHGKAFFYVPAERAKYFPTVKNPHPFGEKVNDAFPSASYDSAEAGMCLALARGTACVFHLMRVLEIGLTVLGKEFGVSLEHTNWAPAIEQIESKIRDMHRELPWKTLPDCKKQQEDYAQAASHFGILKDAWRNYTMHVRGAYTEEQAERMFDNVKAFMQRLAEKLSE